MKYGHGTYRFYQISKLINYSVRIKVRMKQDIDSVALKKAVNAAIKRYPYFAVGLSVNGENAYVLSPNDNEIAVIPTSDRLPRLGSAEIGGHLLFVDFEGRDIYFNISHSLAGGKGITPWVMTNLYAYICERYHIEPDAPGIRKPDSEMLPGECDEPALERIPDEPPIYTYKGGGGALMWVDYLNGFFNPLKKHPEYRVFVFEQRDIMKLARNNDSSVASLFSIIMMKAFDRILPPRQKRIIAELPHSPAAELGMANAHCDMLTYLYLSYTREMAKWDMEKLGTITRSQMFLQCDASCSNYQLRNFLKYYAGIDGAKSLRAKKAYAKLHDPCLNLNSVHGTFMLSYSGWSDLGEVADHIEYFVCISDGHLLLELTAMTDKIFLSFMQLIRNEKYVNAFMAVLDELHIPFSMEGPYSRNLPAHELPKK